MKKVKYRCRMCGKEIWMDLEDGELQSCEPMAVGVQYGDERRWFHHSIIHNCSTDMLGVAVICGIQDGFSDHVQRYGEENKNVK